jgi:hypothetical protein
MALTQASLSGKLKTEIELLFGSAQDQQILQKLCDSIAQAVVDEIQQNAVVNSTGTVISGQGSGGSVTTTGTVT